MRLCQSVSWSDQKSVLIFWERGHWYSENLFCAESKWKMKYVHCKTLPFICMNIKVH